MAARDGIRAIVLPVLAGLVLVGIAVLSLRPAAVSVDVARVERGPMLVTVDAEGKTRVRVRFEITAPADGHLDRILLREGDAVAAGQTVARIDPVPLTASVQEALQRIQEWKAQKSGVVTLRPKAEELSRARTRIEAARAGRREAQARVEQAQARLDQAHRDAERARELASTGAISRKERETAELEEVRCAKELDASAMAAKVAASEIAVTKAELAVLTEKQSDPDYMIRVYDAKIKATEAELSRLRDEAARTDVRSPVSGKVLRVLQQSERFVTDGTPLLELANTNQLELVIDVLSNDAMRIKPGQRIILDQTDNGRPLEGKVRLIEPSAFTETSALGVEEQRVNVIGDLNDGTTAIGDKYRIDAHIVVWESPDVVTLPPSALFRSKNDWCVFVVKEGKARRRKVDIGNRNQLQVEVLAGLAPGDVVILHPSDQVEDGKAVAPRKGSL